MEWDGTGCVLLIKIKAKEYLEVKLGRCKRKNSHPKLPPCLLALREFCIVSVLGVLNPQSSSILHIFPYFSPPLEIRGFSKIWLILCFIVRSGLTLRSKNGFHFDLDRSFVPGSPVVIPLHAAGICIK